MISILTESERALEKEGKKERKKKERKKWMDGWNRIEVVCENEIEAYFLSNKSETKYVLNELRIFLCAEVFDA